MSCHPRIMQATVSSTKFQKFASNECQHTQKVATLETADQGGHILTMKLDSQLNDMIMNLTTGEMIKLINF